MRVSSIEEETHIPSREQSRIIKEVGRKRFKEALEKGTYVKKPDYGRTWVYRNEDSCWRNMDNLKVTLTIDQLRAECEKIFADERVKEIDPFVGEPIHIQDSWREGAIAWPYRRLIRFGTFKTNWTMYHEIAHLLAPADLHGKVFCQRYVQLVEWFIGQDAANKLAKNLCV